MTSIPHTLKNALTLGASQAKWGLGVEKPRVEKRARQAYRNTFHWYDGEGPPDGVDTPIERYAYSEREHWEAVMDELDIEYDDIREQYL